MTRRSEPRALLAGELEVRALFARVRRETDDALTRLDVRAVSRGVMAQRRMEVLDALPMSVRSQEARALNLLRKPDYPNIRPRLVYVTKADTDLWTYLRCVVSWAPYLGRPTRKRFLLCVDEISGGVLGVVEINSDLLISTPRDKAIGWTTDQRNAGGLNHVLAVGTCVAAQPFGLLTGCKFMLPAVASQDVVATWERVYVDPIVAVTTTSLYGKSSAYNRLPTFDYLGETQGFGLFHLSESDWATIKSFVRANGIVGRVGLGGNQVTRTLLLQAVMAKLRIDMKDVGFHQPKGVYLSLLCPNARDVLLGAAKAPVGRVLPSQRELADGWLKRWAMMRWPKVQADVRAWSHDAYRLHIAMEDSRRCAAMLRSAPVPDPRAGSVEIDAAATHAD